MRQVILLLSLIIPLMATAQVDRDPPTPVNPQIRINNNRVFGKVVDVNTNKALEAATVQLYIYPRGSITDSLAGGMFTRSNGDFSFNNLPEADSFRVEISGIGYQTWTKIITSPQASGTGMAYDLGNVLLEQMAQVMTGIVIT
ncbi:MAG: carboxypeptidase regulatory-like domain-containing protein, partial [Flavisolibacter sp.]